MVSEAPLNANISEQQNAVDDDVLIDIASTDSSSGLESFSADESVNSYIMMIEKAKPKSKSYKEGAKRQGKAKDESREDKTKARSDKFSSSRVGDDDQQASDYALYRDEKSKERDIDYNDFNSDTSPTKGLCSCCHLLEVLILMGSVGAASYYALEWNWLYAMCINFALLTLQLIISVDKLPGLRLNTEAYLDSPVVEATVEKTIIKTRYLTRRVYMVRYGIQTSRYMRIRKLLEPGLYDGNIINDENSTKLVTVGDDSPFSAYPKAVIEVHHKRYMRWLRYGIPLLIATIVAFVYNMYAILFVQQRWGTDGDTIWFAAAINFLLGLSIITPLAYKFRKWKKNVTLCAKEAPAKELCSGDEV